MLRLAPPLTAALVAAPVVAGLAFTLLPAFDILPSLGRTHPSLDAWVTLVRTPGFGTAMRLTLVSGIGATLLSFALAVAFCAVTLSRPRGWWWRALQLPILASPHSAVALGLAFLIAPSGWLVRLVSPWATGWAVPPGDLVTIRDSWGFALILGLVLKETPYLVLMIVAASAQLPAAALMATAGSLGQRPSAGWLKAVFPAIYPQIRLPVFAVLAFSLSVVDVALILAPGNPPPLAVLAVRWLTNYDLTLYGPAAAAATLVMLIVVGAIALWRMAERPVARLACPWIERGGPSPLVEAIIRTAGGIAVVGGAMAYAGGAALALWSVARAWPFPAAWPTGFSLATWVAEAPHALATVLTTIAIGALVVSGALTLALACLEAWHGSSGTSRRRVEALLFGPLLVPQVAFLFGVQIVLVRVNRDGTLIAVAWTHLVFVLPYVLLSLRDPFRALDPRYAQSAGALGAGRARIFFAVKLPLLARPIATAAAVGFSVSLAQYLPTLFAGAGRVATVTTEAVTLAGGGDRRIIGVFALLQAALPLAAYGIAVGAPALVVYRRKRGRSS